ncbi:hypothetical protein [Marinobacter sp. SS21]|uniref:hypothetical protein n=1 Tax=Marinobacter sp. SS21 TaxID=2979460 RepID=UPI002330860C|nr:hypothetical protein [Marinobacter sp. SS21]MDC0661528.1 hypothetical protein [Marinobacter sp. SS21]
MNNEVAVTQSFQIRHRWRVVLSTIIFIVGLWAYLAVVEIRNPDRPLAIHGDTASAMFWSGKPQGKLEEQMDTIKKLP